jgi:LmbE family N-acetylglucosaminyl deacetylase
MKLLGIGAHYDDCIFGIPGILLRAVDQGHEVVILSVIGDYRNWTPVGEERQNDLIEGMRRLCEEKGVEARFLNYRSMDIEVNEASKRAVAEVVVEVAPDVGFLLWPRDSHPDHEVVSQLSKVAFNWSGTVLGDRVQRPRRLYYYDNGPRHTFGFEPDTFVDIGDYWSEARDWLGSLMSLVFGSDPGRDTGPVEAKKTLAAYRGKSCGVQFAEALKCFQSYPIDILRL